MTVTVSAPQGIQMRFREKRCFKVPRKARDVLRLPRQVTRSAFGSRDIVLSEPQDLFRGSEA